MTWQTAADATREAIAPPGERGTTPKNLGAITSFAVEHWQRSIRAAGWAEDDIARAVPKGMEAVERLWRHCESPIEKAIAPWLVFCTCLGPHPVSVYCPKEGIDLEATADPVIIPQFAFIRYRADFAVVTGRPAGPRRIVVIECDGAEHHAGGSWNKRDIVRDGLFATFGIRTIRASGTEIYTAPLAVVGRLRDALYAEYAP